MTRKAPHTRARSGPGISTAARAPMIAPNTPPPPIHSAGRRRTLPSRMWVMPPTIAVGTMATRDVPWATAWDAPKPTVMVGTNSNPPPMPMVPLRKPAPKPPATAITSGQLTATSRKDELLHADDAEDDSDGDLELALRNAAQQPGPQVGAHNAADDEEQGGMEVHLRRSLAEVIDRQGGKRDRDDRDERVGIGVPLPDARPQHL